MKTEWKKQPNDSGIEEFLWVNGKLVAWVERRYDGMWVFTWAKGNTGTMLHPGGEKTHGPFETINAAKLAAEMMYG